MNIRRSLSLCIPLLCLAVSSLWALDGSRRVTQYGHTAWRVQDGTLMSKGSSLAQTTDGYIWLGTSNGLMRFDGVRFVPWQPPTGPPLSVRITYLLGGRDGSLWIGTISGVKRWKDGKLQDYPGPEHSGVAVIIEDHTGAIWITRYHLPQGEGPLCRVGETDIQCYGKSDGIPITYGLGLTEDSSGNLWIGSRVLCRWRPGSSTTYFGDVLDYRKIGDGVIDVAAGPASSVWATIDGVGPDFGVRYYSGGKWSSYRVPGFDGAAVRSHALFVDRNQTLWVGTEGNGLYHIHDGIADHYGIADGLSGNSVGLVYEDHENNLWVVTDGGVDMFRDTPVVSFSTREGLSSADIRSILALRDGTVWIGNESAVDILQAGKHSSLSAHRDLPGQDVSTLFQDHAGTVWLGLDDKLLAYKNGRLHEVKRPDGSSLGKGGELTGITEDVDHNLWILTEERHLFRIANQNVQEDIPLSNGLDHPEFLAADLKQGVWIGSRVGSVSHYFDGQFQTIQLKDNAGSVPVFGLFVDYDNSLWVPTRGGLFLRDNGRWRVLDSRNGLPCNAIFSVIKDDHGALWLYAQCGLLKIEASELARWREHPDSHLAFTVFDARDGAHPGMPRPMQPSSSKATDGRLWFTNGALAQVIDPNHLHENRVPPPVQIEGMVADHKSYPVQEHLRLPALTRDIQIDYTALSFSVPQKVRFRYRLEGYDADWQEPGTRRQAFYSNLRPGPYRFRVIAANNDGVWNNDGAALGFYVTPAWYQTTLFLVLCVASAVFLFWLVYRLRVRQIAKSISARFDERLAERTRMARELHDTFLQTVQGSKMVVDDALETPGDSARMLWAMERLSRWLAQANEEGRAVLNALRESTTQGNDLAEALRRATENGFIPKTMTVNFSVVGECREMHPIVRDEVYRIGYEAIRNACLHSGANRLEVELRYGQDVAVRVSDNGKGIDSGVVDKGKEGHFGLQGMRERAARIGGQLKVVTSAGTGTSITITVPGGLVYRKTSLALSKRIKMAVAQISNNPS